MGDMYSLLNGRITVVGGEDLDGPMDDVEVSCATTHAVKPEFATRFDIALDIFNLRWRSGFCGRLCGRPLQHVQGFAATLRPAGHVCMAFIAVGGCSIIVELLTQDESGAVAFDVRIRVL